MRRLRLGNANWVRELLQASIKTSFEQRFLHRLHCVLLVAEGRSCYEVARWFGEDARTIERWVHALEAHGEEGLRERHSGGRPARLAGEQKQHLLLDLQKPPRACGYPESRWSGKRLAQHVAERYGIKLSTRQCQRMMHRLSDRPHPPSALSTAHAATNLPPTLRRVPVPPPTRGKPRAARKIS
jgi:transposase